MFFLPLNSCLIILLYSFFCLPSFVFLLLPLPSSVFPFFCLPSSVFSVWSLLVLPSLLAFFSCSAFSVFAFVWHAQWFPGLFVRGCISETVLVRNNLCRRTPAFTPCFFYSTPQSPQYFSQISLIYLQCTTQSYSKLPKPKTTEMCILESGSKSICPNRPFWTEKTKNRRPRQCEASGYIWEGTING